MYILIDHCTITKKPVDSTEGKQSIFNTLTDVVEYFETITDFTVSLDVLYEIYFIDITIPISGMLFTILNVEAYNTQDNISNNTLWDNPTIKTLIQGDSICNN